MGYKTLQGEAGWTSVGYPKNFGASKVMHKVDGTRGRVMSGVAEMLGNPMSTAAAVERGSSPPARNRQAMGNNAYKLEGQPDNTWGPVFTNATFELLRFVRDA